LRAAAVRGRFPEGETVNFGWERLSLDGDALSASTGPLLLADGGVVVRWGSAVTGWNTTPLDAYLDDRVSLLVDPPSGA
jgi:hypothetical protein